MSPIQAARNSLNAIVKHTVTRITRRGAACHCAWFMEAQNDERQY